MAQLLLIKNLSVDGREIDDIVGFFKDNHKFSFDEITYFEIQQVKGYTRETLVEFARNKQPETQRIHKLKTANKWTFEIPEKGVAWKHFDDKWYMLAETPKSMFTIMNMTVQERITIADEQATTLDKLNALAHLECKIDMNVLNMVEILELNE